MFPRFVLIVVILLGIGCAARAPAPAPADKPAAAAEQSPPETIEPVKPKSAVKKPATAAKKKKPEKKAPQAAAPAKKAAEPVAQSPWQQTLAREAGDAQLRLNAHYFPSLAWLSARWCEKGGSREPALFYNVDRTPTGFLNLIYGDRNGSGKRYNHVQISGRYFDIWDEFDFGEYLKGEGGRRLEKRSDNEFALVYVFAEKPEINRYDKQVFLDFTARRAAEIGPRQHLDKPRVYVNCD